MYHAIIDAHSFIDSSRQSSNMSKTEAEKLEERKMMGEIHGRHKVLEIALDCKELFFCPCMRCGSDLLSEDHKVGEEDDGTEIFSGYSCKKTGRHPNNQLEKLKEGHGRFMESTDRLMENLVKKGLPSPDPATIEGRITLTGGEVENTKLKEAEDRIAVLKMELSKIEKEREEFKIELAKWKGEFNDLKVKLTAAEKELSKKGEELEALGASQLKEVEELRVKNKIVTQMYEESVLRVKETERALAGSDPLSFMGLKHDTLSKTVVGAGGGAGKGAEESPLSFAGASSGRWGDEEEEEATFLQSPGPGKTPGRATGAEERGPTGTRGRRYADAAAPGKREEQVLINSTKLIKTVLKSKDDVVNFLENVEMLVESIEEFYGSESDELKVKIALLHMNEEVKIDGDVVFKELKGKETYDLSVFMERLFSLNFPSPWSSLDLAFRELKQGESTIIEYSRRFKLFVKKLDLNLKAQKNRFLVGLKDGRVRESMYKQNLEMLDFDHLVRWCVTLTNNMKLERPNVSVFKGSEEGEAPLEDRDGGADACMKIMGVSLTKYWDAADKRGIRGRCFQCFSEQHGATECPLKICKFCERDVKVAQHYSVICPKCPNDLRKFLESRDKAKFDKKKNNVRFTDDYDDYQFESEELSD